MPSITQGRPARGGERAERTQLAADYHACLPGAGYEAQFEAKCVQRVTVAVDHLGAQFETGSSVGGIERVNTSANTLTGLQDNNVESGIGKPPAAGQAARARSYHNDICQHFRTPAGSAFVVLNVLSMISGSIATKDGSGPAEMDKIATAQELPPDILHPFSLFGRVNPYPAYGWLLVNAPVYLDKLTGLWLVTGHSGCSAALRDPRFSAAQGQRLRVRDEALPASMLTTDPPDHDRLRLPGSLLLGPAALNAQAPLIEAEIDRLISGLDPAAEADAVRDIGEPLAVAVLSRILEIEPPQRAAFAAFAKRAAVNLDPLAGAPPARPGGRPSPS